MTKRKDDRVLLLTPNQWKKASKLIDQPIIFYGDVEEALDKMPEAPIFDLVITSPPYDIGKPYEKKVPLKDYLKTQKRIIEKILKRLKPTGSVCWQVGNYVSDNEIVPLDYLFAPIFQEAGLKLRNRIVWHFGHGLNSKRRFSGRYEVVLWYTKTDNYIFNLDDVRIPQKYPGKRHFKGAKKGQLSGNPLGKNPEDVWDIPNVKSNHVEKMDHPCQYPVGLAERLILATTNKGDLVFDPFAGVASSGVGALLHGRNFWGCEIMKNYADQGKERLIETLDRVVKYRPFDKPIFNPESAPKLHNIPEEWKKNGGKAK